MSTKRQQRREDDLYGAPIDNDDESVYDQIERLQWLRDQFERLRAPISMFLLERPVYFYSNGQKADITTAFTGATSSESH